MHVRSSPALVLALGIHVALPLLAGRADARPLTFSAPPSYTTSSTEDGYRLVRDDARVTLQLRLVEVASDAGAEAMLRALADEMGRGPDAQSSTVEKAQGIWTLSHVGRGEGEELPWIAMVRRFRGRDAVVLEGTATATARGALREDATSLLRSATLRGAGGPAATAAAAGKDAVVEVGPLVVTVPHGWQATPTATSVRILRDGGDLALVVSEARTIGEEAALARSPLALSGGVVAPLGEPDVGDGYLFNEWGNERLAARRAVICEPGGCLSLLAVADAGRRFERETALELFLDRAGLREPIPVTPKRAPEAPRKDSLLARQITGKRLAHESTSADSVYGVNGSVFVGGSDAREYHFCSDGTVLTSGSSSLLGSGAVGVEEEAADSARGTWAITDMMGIPAGVHIVWQDGREDTLIVGESPFSTYYGAYAQGTTKQRREIERVMDRMRVPIILLRFGETYPKSFEATDSASCAR